MSLRTLTYVVKMDTADGKLKARDFRVTLKTLEQDTQKASKKVDDLAKSIGDKYATNVKTAVDQTKTVAAEIRAAARESSRSERIFQQLSEEYAHLSSRTGKTAEEQEILNAQYRLGRGATKAQREEVERLVTAYQKKRAVANQTQGSLRGLRGQAQNLGWQLQDVAVQAQMGTNALVILGQQGSQLAAGFGPQGALVGAAIAVGAALLGVASASAQAKKDASELDSAISSLTSNLENLTAQQRFAAQLAFQQELKKSNEAVELQTRKLYQLNKAYSDHINGLREMNATEEAENRQQVTEATIKQAAAMVDAQKAQEGLNQLAGEGFGDTTEAAGDLIARMVDLNNTYGKSRREVELYKAEKLGLGEEYMKIINMVYDQVDAYDKEKEAAAQAAKDAVKAAKDKEKAERDAAREATKALADSLKEQQRLQDEHQKVLAKYTDTGKLVQLQIQYARERELLQGNQEALIALEAHYADERIKISGSTWEQYAVHVKEKLEDFDEIFTNSIDRFSEGFGIAVADAVFESEDLGEALGNMFKNVAKNMVAFFAEWAAHRLTLWILEQNLGKTANVAGAKSITMQAQAKAKEAELNAFASWSGAPWPISLGAPGAAAATAAVAEPMAAAVSGFAFAGAFDEGGRIPSGSAGIVSEYGDELVGGTMVYNGSPNSLQVTGREDTARLRGGATTNNITINSNGNASPEAITRALIRALKKPNKELDNNVFGSTNRGRRNKGLRFA